MGDRVRWLISDHGNTMNSNAYEQYVFTKCLLRKYQVKFISQTHSFDNSLYHCNRYMPTRTLSGNIILTYVDEYEHSNKDYDEAAEYNADNHELLADCIKQHQKYSM